MSMRLPSLTSLRAFEAAARLRSFKKAAEELAVTPMAISHRIRDLEEYFEKPLFLRKVRAIELTANGQTLFTAVRNGLESIAAGVEQVRNAGRASVTLSTTPAFASKWLVPRLASFQAEHPDIDLHVHASNTPVNLNAATADLAIRYGHGPFEGLISTLLMEDHFAPVACPSLLTTLGQDATQWPLIHFDWDRPLMVDLTWDAWAQAAGYASASLEHGICYSEESHAIQATVAGHGVALLSLLLVEEELEQGLLQVVSEPVLKGMSYHILKSRNRPTSEAVATVEAWLTRMSRYAPETS
uniref:LysR substrate-binding domain-containing protein n=1 Tax=Halomonas sp. TaxID=1486246 RepID=UPI00260F3C63|nr:LysR substrate-binding domain-containing protein [Halomonas sp.]